MLDALRTVQTISTNHLQILDVVNEKSGSSPIDDELYYSPSPLLPQPSSPSKTPPETTKKPWLPPKGTECQVKCCHFCRPTFSERAFLSLDGIVNNDIPLTAVYGFGFHLHEKKRPVALVKHVKNLGLRSSPPCVRVPPLHSLWYYRLTSPASRKFLYPTPPRPLLPPLRGNSRPRTPFPHPFNSLSPSNPRRTLRSLPRPASAHAIQSRDPSFSCCRRESP